jgi:hypothetical protein
MGVMLGKFRLPTRRQLDAQGCNFHEPISRALENQKHSGEQYEGRKDQFNVTERSEDATNQAFAPEAETADKFQR